MPTYISILRGINVSGQKLIKMEALKNLCSQLQFENIQTYIQSGNIVFQSKLTNTKKISENIKNAIKDNFGFDVPVMTFLQTEMAAMLQSNPLLKDKKLDLQFFHITFLSDKPSPENIALLQQVALKNDLYTYLDKAIYLYCPDGYGNTKLTNTFLENKLKVVATTRNWKTVNTLLEMTT